MESLEKCILGRKIEATKNYIDFRYFYPGSDGKTRCLCGLALCIMAAWLR
jgi:hypothetical protein